MRLVRSNRHPLKHILLISCLWFVCLLFMATCSDPKSSPPPPTISLHEAAKTGNMGQVKAHIYWESDVNMTDESGKTPIQVAYEANQEKVVQELLSHGAKLSRNGSVSSSDEQTTNTERLAHDRKQSSSMRHISQLPYLKISESDASALESGDPSPMLGVIKKQYESWVADMDPEEQQFNIKQLLDRGPVAIDAVAFAKRAVSDQTGVELPPHGQSASKYNFRPITQAQRVAYYVSRKNYAMRLYLKAAEKQPALYDLLEVAYVIAKKIHVHTHQSTASSNSNRSRQSREGVSGGVSGDGLDEVVEQGPILLTAGFAYAPEAFEPS